MMQLSTVNRIHMWSIGKMVIWITKMVLADIQYIENASEKLDNIFKLEHLCRDYSLANRWWQL